MSGVGKKQLFDDSASDEDDDSKIKINKSYAQRYDEWREAEIKKKLEDRYGNLDEELSSSSSDDDDDPQELEKALSKDFFEVISQLKKRDPKIYNQEVQFFNTEDQPSTSQVKKKKEKPIYLRDYERKLIVERGGVLSDDESDTEGPERPGSPSLAEKERSLKESLQKVVHSDSDDDGGLLTKKVKTADEKKKEEDDYFEWLQGRKEALKDKSLEESLSHLKEEWSNPNLDDGEKFLRDYVLNKRYLDAADEDVDTGNITDEDYQDEYMDEFERKYNFRFEEPDSAFLKNYPRTIESSVRKKDDRRKRHRDEVKKRKEEEKLRQKEELKVLKSLKRKEILKKIEKLKEITGNAELGISDKDLEGDYDPEEHDKRMNELFNDDYYQEGDDEMNLEDLPLPPLEEELVDDYENWDEYGGEKDDDDQIDEELHCEDPGFNMDCDYDPEAAQREKETRPKSSRERRKLKRQSRFGTLVRKKKPEFDPNEKSFQQYVDEYYSIDYEDIVGGQPCRFKYRKVTPNSYGLTVEEILAADDKDLNAWISIKKAMALKPEHVELNEKRMYELKAQNEDLKRKILPSLYKQETEENNEEGEDRTRSKKKKKSRGEENPSTSNESNQNQTEIKVVSEKTKKRRRVVEENLPADEDDAIRNVTSKKRQNKQGQNKRVESEMTAEEPYLETPHKEENESDQVQSQENGKKGKKQKRQSTEPASNNAETTFESNFKLENRGKKRPADDLDETSDVSPPVKNKGNNTPGPKKKQKGEKSPKVSKKTETHDGDSGKSSKKNLNLAGNKSKSSDPNQNNKTSKNKHDKNRISQNPISSQRTKRQRRGRDRKKLLAISRKASEAPRDAKVENKARAIRKQSYKPAPILGEMSDSRLKAYGLNPKRFKNKLMYG